MEKHVISTQNGTKISYCGKKLNSLDWAFQDAEHAISTIKIGSHIEVCEDCKKEIIKILEK